MVKQSAKQSAVPSLAFNLLFSIISGFISTFILLVLCAEIFTKMKLPSWSAIPLSTISVGISSFMSGHILARRLKQNGLFCGFCCGAFFFVIYLAAALLNGQFEYTALAAVKLVCYILFGCIGGFTGIIASEHVSKRTKH